MRRRVLFISPTGVDTRNGMLQRQGQILQQLCDFYAEVDVLSLWSSAASMDRWLDSSGIGARARHGPFAMAARFNAIAWYAQGVLLCNKANLVRHFCFPLRTPLPPWWRAHYDLVVGYYPWSFHLLRLDQCARVIVDLGDVMAERHKRIGARRWISLTHDAEREVLERVACIAISQDDQREFQKLYGAKLPLVDFVPPEATKLLALVDHGAPPAVGYFAAPSYQNEEVLGMLAASPFLDALRARSVALVIAGGICDTADPSALARLRAGGATILGRISNPMEFYRQVRVVVNPVGPSTGVKIKSVEALMAGRHLVTTPFGADERLLGFFGAQVTLTSWPIDPGALAQLVVDATFEDNRTPLDIPLAYIDAARHSFGAAFGP